MAVDELAIRCTAPTYLQLVQHLSADCKLREPPCARLGISRPEQGKADASHLERGLVRRRISSVELDGAAQHSVRNRVGRAVIAPEIGEGVQRELSAKHALLEAHSLCGIVRKPEIDSLHYALLNLRRDW